jgi:hypothetical protein
MIAAILGTIIVAPLEPCPRCMARASPAPFRVAGAWPARSTIFLRGWEWVPEIEIDDYAARETLADSEGPEKHPVPPIGEARDSTPWSLRSADACGQSKLANEVCARVFFRKGWRMSRGARAKIIW